MSVARPDRLYEVYVFDLDGTIYLGDGLLPGARRLIEELRAWGAVIRFITNNPTRDPAQYVDMLARLGLPTPIEEIVNTTLTTTTWILDNRPNAVVFPIGEAPLLRALEQAGIALSEEPGEINMVVSSYDRGFTYKKLQIAFDAIRTHGPAELIATNPDRFCPFPGGRGEPDCAAITAAIEACTSTTCFATLGKPNPVMLQTALRGLQAQPADCLMVGDRLATDIRMGLDTGTATALVLTGETTLQDLARLPDRERPRFVVDSIDLLLPRQL